MTQMNLVLKQKQTHRHREQTCGCQGGGMDWEFGISGCKLLYIEWIKKMWYTYTMEYYLAIKKNEIMPFAATWMDLELIILSEVSQKEKYYMISLICGI